jgi:hypothetical protein
MKKLMAAFVVLVLFSVSAHAQNESNIPPECRLLPDHKSQADVAYKPGVDVKGKAVVPADINAVPMIDTDVVVVPLSINLARQIGHSIPGLQLEGNLGYLEIGKDGRVIYNGQDWTSQVHVLCGKQPLSTDGQPPADVIKYEPAETTAPKPAVKPKQPIKPALDTVPTPKPVETPLAAPKQGELITGGESSNDEGK